MLLAPSLICLDAPLVACLWALLLKRSIGDPEASIIPIMALSVVVWGIYLLDRLYDTRNFKDDPNAPIRYRFASHRREALALLAMLVWIGVLAFLPFIPRSMFFGGGLLAFATVFYYGAFRFFQRDREVSRTIPWKELIIALCFAIGILVSIEADFSASEVLLCGFAMACLFLGNCLAISRAESEFDSRHDRSGYFSDRRNTSGRVLPLLATIALLVSLLLMGAFNATLSGWTIFFTALGNLLVYQKSGIDSRFVHAISDLVLLSPPAVVLLIQLILAR